MTLSDFATFSTALSGVAVTASLIYLAIQTRQNLRHTRAQIQQGAAARTTALILANQEPFRAAAWIEGNGGKAGPEEVRKYQFNLMCANAIYAMADLYFQNLDGLLSAELYRLDCENYRALMSQRGLRAYWDSTREGIGRVAPKFRDFVDSLCVGESGDFSHRVG
jgi:hypothetical protein